MSLDFGTAFVPFVAGLNTKTQGQALDAPGLSSAKNVEFDEVGGLRLRKPYATVGANILGGGTLSDTRKIATVGDELLTFTSTSLYTWSETLSKHVSRGAHLAIKVEETTRFGNPSDQVFADRAQLSGLIVYVTTEVLASTTLCYLAAIDATTGATVIAPTSFGAGNTRPRVVALATKILVTWTDAGVGLVCTTIDPASPSFTSAGATLLDTEEGYYDVVKDPTADRAVWAVRFVGGGSYTVGRVTAALAVSSSVKARTADGIISVAVDPTGTKTMILRTDGIVVRGDIVTTATLVDGTVNTSVAAIVGIAAINHMAAEFRSVQNSGQYRCYVFFSTDETDAAVGTGGGGGGVGALAHTYYNYIDTAASCGSAAIFLRDSSVASRAFDYGGTVYVWTAFGRKSGTGSTLVGIGAAYQNSFFLYDDAGTLHSKAAWLRGGGDGYYYGHLPGVALISGSTVFAWCGLERDYIDLSSATFFSTPARAYADRAPRDIVFTFDSDDARRTVRLGDTLYVAGGMPVMYDGESITEVGSSLFPWYFNPSDTGAGNVADGTYTYKMSSRWQNARGEVERSTTATGAAVTPTGGGSKITVDYFNLSATRKQSTRRNLSLELWRTAVGPQADSPFYLVTSRDPSATGDNKYVDNSPNGAAGTVVDNFADATLITKELHPENAGTLPRIAPPGCTIVAASDSRLFLAGIPGDPFAVAYSLYRGDGEIAGFNPALRFSVPPATGAITGLASWQETLIVFTASAVYVVGGQGFDNLGGGTNYGPARLVSSDVGALSHDTIAVTPVGVIFFSRKGWYVLNGGLSLDYIGAKVEDYNTDTWVAAQAVESQHQVRVLSTSRMLVYDYAVGEWAEWTQSGGKALAIWRASPMLLDSAVKKEQSTFSAVDYLMTITTGWIKPAGMQGFARLRRIMVLGEYKGEHAQSIAVGYDYETASTDTAIAGFTTVAGFAAGAPTQLRHGPRRQRIQAFRVTVNVYTPDQLATPPAYDAVTLTGLALEVGLRKGLYPRLPAAQKQ